MCQHRRRSDTERRPSLALSLHLLFISEVIIYKESVGDKNVSYKWNGGRWQRGDEISVAALRNTQHVCVCSLTQRLWGNTRTTWKLKLDIIIKFYGENTTLTYHVNAVYMWVVGYVKLTHTHASLFPPSMRRSLTKIYSLQPSPQPGGFREHWLSYLVCMCVNGEWGAGNNPNSSSPPL